MMSDFTFKATGMYDFYSDLDKPEYYTVLAKKKGKGNKWIFVGNKGGVLKFETLEEAKAEAKALRKGQL